MSKTIYMHDDNILVADNSLQVSLSLDNAIKVVVSDERGDEIEKNPEKFQGDYDSIMEGATEINMDEMIQPEWELS